MSHALRAALVLRISNPQRFPLPSSQSINARPLDDIDPCVLCLLPWLASRYSPVTGSFIGQGEELTTPPGILAAQALSIFNALGIGKELPYLVQRMLWSWPQQDPVALLAASDGSLLVARMRRAVTASPAAFATALRPSRSLDSGYTLEPLQNGYGLMASAYLLLVEIRPAWYAARGFSAPPTLSAPVLTQFSNQLLPVFAP